MKAIGVSQGVAGLATVFAVLFAVAPPAVVFSGFHSTALWLVFGGLIIGVAIIVLALLPMNFAGWSRLGYLP